MGPADRLRQDRLRLPQGPHLERPTSWADLWTLAKKYSGKVTIVDYDVDMLGTALKYKGYSVNATNEGS